MRDKEGKVMSDGDGAFYFEPHPHPAVKGKEFTGEGAMIQAIRDHQIGGLDKATLDQAGALARIGTPEANQAALDLLSNLRPASIGEVVILNVLEF